MLTFVAEFCFVMSRLKIQVSEAKSRQKKKKQNKKRENSITILKIFMFSSTWKDLIIYTLYEKLS